MEHQKERIHWEILVASGMMLLGIVGVNIPLFIHSDDANRQCIEAIRQDVKEFHERLIRIEENRNK